MDHAWLVSERLAYSICTQPAACAVSAAYCLPAVLCLQPAADAVSHLLTKRLMPACCCTQAIKQLEEERAAAGQQPADTARQIPWVRLETALYVTLPLWQCLSLLGQGTSTLLH